MDWGRWGVRGQPWQVDGAGAGGSSLLGWGEAGAGNVMSLWLGPHTKEQSLDHLEKDPGAPGTWVGLGRVWVWKSSARGGDFVLGGVFMEVFLPAAWPQR